MISIPQIYWLCVYASGSLIIEIFHLSALIRVSCLHFGKIVGNFLTPFFFVTSALSYYCRQDIKPTFLFLFLCSVSFLSGMKHYSRYLSEILTDSTATLPPLVTSILFTNFLFSRMIKSSFLFSVCVHSRRTVGPS